jgi:hypothetical protein
LNARTKKQPDMNISLAAADAILARIDADERAASQLV